MDCFVLELCSIMLCMLPRGVWFAGLSVWPEGNPGLPGLVWKSIAMDTMEEREPHCEQRVFQSDCWHSVQSSWITNSISPDGLWWRAGEKRKRIIAGDVNNVTGKHLTNNCFLTYPFLTSNIIMRHCGVPGVSAQSAASHFEERKVCWPIAISFY